MTSSFTHLSSLNFYNLLGIGVWSPPSSRNNHNIHKSAVVLLSSLCTTGFGLLLLLGINLWCLSVNFTSKQSLTKVNGGRFLKFSLTQGLLILKRSTSKCKNLIVTSNPTSEFNQLFEVTNCDGWADIVDVGFGSVDKNLHLDCFGFY